MEVRESDSRVVRPTQVSYHPISVNDCVSVCASCFHSDSEGGSEISGYLESQQGGGRPQAGVAKKLASDCTHGGWLLALGSWETAVRERVSLCAGAGSTRCYADWVGVVGPVW